MTEIAQLDQLTAFVTRDGSTARRLASSAATSSALLFRCAPTYSDADTVITGR